MKILGHENKEIFKLSRTYNRNNGGDNAIRRPFDMSGVEILELSDKIREFDENNKSQIKDGMTLFFDKSAVFPRYKLQDTSFKRCIKIDKADAIVIGDLKNFAEKTYGYIVYENEDSILFSDYDPISSNALVNQLNLDYKLIYSGRCVRYYNKGLLLVEGLSKPFIKDSDLDDFINKTLPTITLDDVKQIESMLSSSDTSVIDLGLKLLAGFNVNATPLTISALLFKNQNWRGTNALNSVSIQTLLKSIDFNKYFYSSFPQNLCSYARYRTFSDEDSNLCKSYIFDKIKEIVFANIKDITEDLEKPPFNFKFNINVE